MQKKMFYLIICAVIVLGIFLGSFAEKEKNPATKAGYILKIEDNTVKVYKSDGKDHSFYRELNEANIFDMPENVYESLKKGVFAENSTQLEKIIEEITS